MRNSAIRRELESYSIPGDPDIKSFAQNFNQVEADAFHSVLLAEDHDDFLVRNTVHNCTVGPYDLAVESVVNEEFDHFVLQVNKEEDSHIVTPERWETIRAGLKGISKKAT